MFIIIYEQILQERTRIEEEIKSLELQLQQCPEGNLILTHSGKYNKFYHSLGSKQTYIPKKNYQLTEKLAYKKYLTLQLQDLLQEKEALDFYLRHHQEVGHAEELLNKADFQKILSPYFKPISEELYEWVNAPFPQNPSHPEHLTHQTFSGHLVRSKSEAIIDMFLFKNKIPFRYECELKLGNRSVYPDFTTRHPKTGDFYYWEHFGMMDDHDYCSHACSKIARYAKNGIIPGINLITTCETKEHPLSMKTVEHLVNQYFLEN